jgi:hypothetical protein
MSMFESLALKIMLYKIQQQNTTLGKKNTSRLVLNSNFLKVFFKTSN